jgi:hypothetical protein
LVLYQRRFREKPSGLAFLMRAMVGIYSFLGPLAGAALGGDFYLAFTFLQTSTTVAYLASAIGFILLPSFMYYIGRELLRPGTSVVSKLSHPLLLHLGSLELSYSCCFIGRCRDF